MVDGLNTKKLLDLFEQAFNKIVGETAEFFPVREVCVMRGVARDGLHWVDPGALAELQAGKSICLSYDTWRSGQMTTIRSMGEAATRKERMLCYLAAFVYEMREVASSHWMGDTHKAFWLKAHFTVFKGGPWYDSRCKSFLPLHVSLELGQHGTALKQVHDAASLATLAAQIAVEGMEQYCFIRVTTYADELGAARDAKSAGIYLERALAAYRAGRYNEAASSARSASDLLYEAEHKKANKAS